MNTKKTVINFAYPKRFFGSKHVAEAFAYLKQRFPDYDVVDTFFKRNGTEKDIDAVRNGILDAEMLVILENGQMLTRDVYEFASYAKSYFVDVFCIRKIESTYILTEVDFINEVYLSENEYAIVSPYWPDDLRDVGERVN